MQLKQDFFTQLPDFYSQVMPQGLSEPKWLGWSRDAARLVGLSQPTDELLAQFNQHIDGAIIIHRFIVVINLVVTLLISVVIKRDIVLGFFKS